MDHMKMGVHPDCADAAAQKARDGLSWWPLDCLRSLGRAASIAAGTTAPHGPLHIAAEGQGVPACKPGAISAPAGSAAKRTALRTSGS